MKRVLLMSLLALMPLAAEAGVESMKNLQQPVEGKPAVFSFGGEGGREFTLDGVPFQIRSGEIHPQRVPRQHWRHRIRAAKAMGLNLIDAGHFHTENPVCTYLVERLQAAFPDVEVVLSEVHRDCAKFFL